MSAPDSSLGGHRKDDEPFITVSRTVPIWALIGGLVSIVALGVSLQAGQSSSAKAIQDLTQQVALLNSNYQAQISSAIEVKLRVEAMQSRLSALEAKK